MVAVLEFLCERFVLRYKRTSVEKIAIMTNWIRSKEAIMHCSEAAIYFRKFLKKKQSLFRKSTDRRSRAAISY